MTHPTAQKLQALSLGLTAPIARKRATRLENTPKRQHQGMTARIDANQMERVQRALSVLAEAWESSSVPPKLKHLTTKAAIWPLVKKKIESRSYYHVCELDTWCDLSPAAIVLRDLIASKTTNADVILEAHRVRVEKVRAMEEDIRFNAIPGFFPTPHSLILDMIAEAKIFPGMTVLEPSAGKGDIADQLLGSDCKVTCIEHVQRLADICIAKGHETYCRDFLEESPEPFDRILMNPPFGNLADCDHVRRAWEWLKPGGRMVAIMSASSTFSARAEWFREWAIEIGAEVDNNEPDAFKSAWRSTSVRTVMFIAEKPYA